MTGKGVTRDEIRIAITDPSQHGTSLVEVGQALVAHFNLRYEFYGRRLRPVFVTHRGGYEDPVATQAFAEELIATKPFAVPSWLGYTTSAAIYRRLSQAGVVSAVSLGPAFKSESVADGLTWLVDPTMDVQLRDGARLVCRAFVGGPASHAGTDVRATTTSRRFALLVQIDSRAPRPDPGPLESGLRGCGADFKSFDISISAGQNEWETLMLQLKAEGFTTILIVSFRHNAIVYPAATSVGYFPEWLYLGEHLTHSEFLWAGTGRPFTNGHGDHAFGITPQVRIRHDADVPAMWALREGGGAGAARIVDPLYQSLLVLASGIQGAGPNLNPETFARALRTMKFPNPSPGAPPHWQQRISFGSGDEVFHDDYAIWWWNDTAPSQTSDSTSGRGSFCYLNRGARFTPDGFPTDADTRLFSPQEPCR